MMLLTRELLWDKVKLKLSNLLGIKVIRGENMKRIYMDHSATTPVRIEAATAAMECMTAKYGNPSSVHYFGREAKATIDKARGQVAALINAQPEEIVFTSGGTEADNIALQGVAKAYAHKGKHIITTAIEHHAILNTCAALAEEGFDITYLPVDEMGLVSVADVEKAITPQTILISVMHANNEVGTIQPIAEIGQLAKEKGILMHTDAVQSLGKLPVDVQAMNVDLLSGSGHKFYAPKGTGFLYVRKGVRLKNIMFGGGQEWKKRSGTENLPGIVGLGVAAELASQEMVSEIERISKLRDKLINGIQKRIPHVRLNGHPEKRVATNVNFCYEFIEGESLLLSLDLKGIAASSGSACSSGSLEPSHVLIAMGLSHEIAQGSVRMTLGKDNSEEDIDYVLEVLPPIVERLRAMSPLYNKPSEGKCEECTLKK